MSIDSLTENDVIEAVCAYLERRGFRIQQRLTTQQKGDDIVATLSGARISIEAKGATSARKGSARFGKPFDSAQIRVHVAEAVYKAAQVLSRPREGEKLAAGIALPSTRFHLREIESVELILRDIGVTVYWVHADGCVEEKGPGLSE